MIVYMLLLFMLYLTLFFFNDTATTEIYTYVHTLSLHDALPIFEGLADELIRTERSAIYGRIGTCTQSFGTLASWMIDVLAILTGNLDREGGSMWSRPVAPLVDMLATLPEGKIGRAHV